ncbi:MAG: cytochrome b/b6 domain-containing protein [Coriobacteriia bacterium]|nr:cytochrome b/b6 domain-containing protein [Coriobacteriia bacterium]
MSHPAHYREAHPMVFVLTHWINLIAMISLAFSGFYIHYPFFAGFMGVARGMHFFFMYVLIINLTFRIIAAFFVKDSVMLGTREQSTDIKNWLPQAANRHQMIPWIKYYLFMKKDHPLGGKYGVLQKIAYIATIPLTYVMAYTGFAIYSPTASWGFFNAGTMLVGGPMSMRIVHYFMMWAFIVFTAIHAYLANVEGFAPSRLIFVWKESEGVHFDPKTGKATGGGH